MLKNKSLLSVCTILVFFLVGSGYATAGSSFKVKSAKWDKKRGQLTVKGNGLKGATVSLLYINGETEIANQQLNGKKWQFSKLKLSDAPCRIRVEQSDGSVAEKAVKKAPADCSNGNEGTIVATGSASSDNIKLAAASIGDGFKIEEASWDRERKRLTVKGKGNDGKTVSLLYAGSLAQIASNQIDGDDWRIRQRNLSPVPCRVRADQSDGQTAEKDVKYAPSNCDSGTGGGGPAPLTGNFTVLAANDLGMHCADTDYRIFSILPPYNVINAQVLRKGGEPKLMTPADGIEVTYKAVASNIIDPNKPELPPIAMDSFNSTSENDLPTVYKSNFWEPENVAFKELFGFLAYEKLYPPNILAAFPLRDPADGGLLGLPAPNIERLYLGDGELHAEQSAMPGKANPFVANDPQHFHGFVENLPFFVNFPFGYEVQKFRRYTAEGVPIMPTDDKGRANAYPLMRVQAQDQAGNVLAAVDTVLPVASEADCQSCHLDPLVCTEELDVGVNCGNVANSYNSASFITSSNINSKYSDSVDTSDPNFVPGDTEEQVILNAAKINILRLHDAKNDTALDDQRNVVCANCHYSPALDLAHLGPTDLNGKQQTRHRSMSRVMHSYHANLPVPDNPDDPDKYNANDPDGKFANLFPLMPIADDPLRQQIAMDAVDGNGKQLYPDAEDNTQTVEEYVLEQTCYSCHPGKRTKCLRGAMSDGGVVCQDCHGQGTQVGNDFTENFPNIAFPAEGSADLDKRVSWASEPKCDSCHVGDVLQVKQLLSSGDLNDVLLNTADKRGNDDGLRLRMAYKISDHKLSPGGGSPNLALLDYPDSRFASDQPLYRLSGASDEKGHGGLFCEGCHGSTHAIWPNANPWANDNKAAMDLQGHTGTLIECSTCHEGDLGMTLKGPHGMHPVGDTKFAREHDDFAKDNRAACQSCHGEDGEGSVLSRTATERVLQAKEDHIKVTYPTGTPVGCGDCHENKLKNP